LEISMINVIPRFVSAMLRDGQAYGRIDGSAVFVDITGFTSITERLMSHGKDGAEVLSGIINRVFGPPISRIHESGGFLASFGGDSFSVVLPGRRGEDAQGLAGSIVRSIARRSRQKTRLGSFDISVKTGISEGGIEWGILGFPGQRAYYFRGGPIFESAARAADAPVDHNLDGGSYERPCGEASRSDRVLPSIARQFVPDQVVSGKLGGEFRDVVPVFVSFGEPGTHRELDEIVGKVIQAAASFGGYLAGIYFEEKGPLLLTLFGAPRSYEHMAERAAHFALRVRDTGPSQVRISLTRGVAYAGFVGTSRRCTYTAIGDTVNTSARIVCQAGWGEVMLTERVSRHLEEGFALNDGPSLALKGKAEAVGVRLLEKSLPPDRESLFDVPMVGRAAELEEITSRISDMVEQRCFGGVVCVYGDAGTGKSLLAGRALDASAETVVPAIMETDEILRKSLNPFVYFLRDLFDQVPGGTGEAARESFDRRMHLLLADLKIMDDPRAEEVTSELQRTRTVLGAALGLSWPDSVYYESLSAKGRFDNKLIALKELIKGLSLIKPVVILLEDLQWLDADSIQVFRSLARNVESFPFMLLVTSRFDDDGSRPSLGLDEEVSVTEIALGPLDEMGSRELIGDVLGGAGPDDQLVGFVRGRCGGNPFYTRQVCLHLQENGLIGSDGQSTYLTGTTSGMPTGVKEILVARLDRLSARLRALVQTASVLGREFNVRVLSRMLRGEKSRSLVDSIDLHGIWAPLSEII
jgi:GGDEF domain-containing protein